MKHGAIAEIWDLNEKLPINVRNLADKNYALLEEDSKYQSLHFKSVGKFWSVRVGIRYRALAIEVDDGFLCFQLEAIHNMTGSMLCSVGSLNSGLLILVGIERAPCPLTPIR